MAALGIRIVEAGARPAPLSARADVAFAVGEIARRDGTVDPKRETPQFFESFAAFAQVFAWERRPVAFMIGAETPTNLGLAVRSFFAEGGRACYVLRVGDPEPLAGPDRAAPPQGTGQDDPWDERRLRRLAALAPANIQRADLPQEWSGVGHLNGLADVSLLIVPDLPDIVAARPETTRATELMRPVEIFRPDGASAPDMIGAPARRPPVSAPRVADKGWKIWAEAVASITSLLGAGSAGPGRRDVTFIATLPLAKPAGSDPACGAALQALTFVGVDLRCIQLVHPWAETAGSAGLPEGLQPPDGIVAGAIAANALARGGFRSAAGRPLRSVRRLAPAPERRWTDRPAAEGDRWLGDAVSLIEERQGAFRLASDVVAGGRRTSRPAGLRRLQGILLRAARAAGEDLVFEPSVEATWTRLRWRLEALLAELLALGAFAGASRVEAFQVRCDRSTMTQSDIDNGRLIALVDAVAAHPIERITVTLELQDGRAAIGRAA